MSFNISYIYHAIDEFTPVAKKIAKTVADLKQKITQSKTSLKGFNVSLRETAKLSALVRGEVEGATGAITKMGNAADRTNRITSRMSLGSVGKRLSSMGKGMKGTGASMSGFITAPLVGGAIEALKSSASIETMTASFGVILHSAGKAKELMDSLKHQTLNTPYLLPDLGDSARMLLSANVPLKDVNSKITMLGNVAAGANMPLQNMAAIFAKVKNQGRVMARDLYQLNKTPIRNILKNMISKDGKPITDDDFRKVVSKGIVTSKMYEAALRMLTSKSGPYFHKMQTMMDTLAGRWSNVQHASMLASAEIGDDLARILNLKELMKSFADKLQDWTKEFHNWTIAHPILAKLVVYFGVFLAVLGPVLLYVGLVSMAFGAMATGLTALGGIAGTLALPFAGVLGILAAILGPTETMNFLFEATKTVVNLISLAFRQLKQDIAELVPHFEWFDKMTSKLKSMGFISPTAALKQSTEWLKGFNQHLDNAQPVHLDGSKITDTIGPRLQFDNSGPGASNSFYGPMPQASMSGHITVAATPGSQVVSTRSSSKNADFSLGQNMSIWSGM